VSIILEAATNINAHHQALFSSVIGCTTSAEFQ